MHNINKECMRNIDAEIIRYIIECSRKGYVELPLICDALLIGLSKRQLEYVRSQTKDDIYLPFRIKDIIAAKFGENKLKNEPISKVVELFENKDSKQVEKARKVLKSRYDYQAKNEQNLILHAMLGASKADRDWAYHKLIKSWDESFRNEVLELWKQYNETLCAQVIIAHFPKDDIVLHYNELERNGNYKHLCFRLARDLAFPLDYDRLSPIDYLQIVEKTGREVSDKDLEVALYKITAEICNQLPPLDIFVGEDVVMGRTSAMHLSQVRKAFYILGSMKRFDVMLRFKEWDDAISQAVEEKIHQRYSQSVFDPNRSIYDYMEEVNLIVRDEIRAQFPKEYAPMLDPDAALVF